MKQTAHLIAFCVGLASSFGCIQESKLPRTIETDDRVAVPGNESDSETPPHTPTVEPTPFECEAANCAGEPWPQWELFDFQPNSDRFEETYSLDYFKGKTTLVVLLAGWCGYCRSQALHLQALYEELQDERVDVNVVVINKTNAASPNYQSALIYVLDEENQIQKDDNNDPIYRCTFPLFQDTEEINSWELHNGNKDDFYIYDEEGILGIYLPRSNSAQVSTNLSTDEGFGNVKQAILDVYHGDSPSNQ